MSGFILLKGISMDDITNIYNENLLNKKLKKTNILGIANKINVTFSEFDNEWCKKNSIKCFYCGLDSYNNNENPSIPYPSGINEDRSINVKYYCCSFGCCMSLLFQNNDDNDIKYLIHEIYKRKYGVKPEYLEKGLNKNELTIYGTGNIPPLDFMKINKERETNIKI